MKKMHRINCRGGYYFMTNANFFCKDYHESRIYFDLYNQDNNIVISGYIKNSGDIQWTTLKSEEHNFSSVEDLEWSLDMFKRLSLGLKLEKNDFVGNIEKDKEMLAEDVATAKKVKDCEQFDNVWLANYIVDNDDLKDLNAALKFGLSHLFIQELYDRVGQDKFNYFVFILANSKKEIKNA